MNLYPDSASRSSASTRFEPFKAFNEPTTSPMKVLVIDASWYSVEYDRAFICALSEVGAQTVFVTSDFALEALWLQTRKNTKRIFFRLCALPTMRKICLKYPSLRRFLKAVEYPLDWIVVLGLVVAWRPNVIHFQWVMSPIVDVWLIRLLRALGFPVIYTAHNILPHDHHPKHRDMYALLYDNVDKIIVHTETSKHDLLALVPELKTESIVIPHGILFENLAPHKKHAARELLGLEKDLQIVLFLGVIAPYKGLSVLIEAMAHVLRFLPTAYLIIAGRPNEDISPYVEQVRKLGLEESVQMALRYLPSEELPAYYCAADVVALPYRGIYQSAGLLTAFRFAVPVVATNVGGFKDCVEDGKSGYLVPVDDAGAMAHALLKMLSDPQSRDEMSDYIRTQCKPKFSWSSIANRTMSVYRDTIGH